MIKKYGWVIIVAIVLFFVAGFYQKCQDDRLKKAVAEVQVVADDLKDQLDTAIQAKQEIWDRYQAHIAEPPETITNVETKIVQLTDSESKKVAEEAILLAKFWKAEHDRVVTLFTEYREADVLGNQELLDSIFKLNNKIQTLSSVAISTTKPLGIAPYVGYELYPEQHISVGICVYYRLNLYKILSNILGG